MLTVTVIRDGKEHAAFESFEQARRRAVKLGVGRWWEFDSAIHRQQSSLMSSASSSIPSFSDKEFLCFFGSLAGRICRLRASNCFRVVCWNSNIDASHRPGNGCVGRPCPALLHSLSSRYTGEREDLQHVTACCPLYAGKED